MIKRILVSLGCLFVGAGMMTAQKLSTVEGLWKDGPQEVTLFRVYNGARIKQAVSSVDRDGRFAMAFYHDQEGFFVLAKDALKTDGSHTFYFRPGDRLGVEFAGEGYTLTGKNTAENREMARWNEVIAPLNKMLYDFQYAPSSYVEFFPLLDSKVAEEASYEQKYKKNRVFNEAFGMLRRNDLVYASLFFLMTPRMIHPSGEDYGRWYRELDMGPFTGDLMLKYPYGMKMIDLYMFLSPKFRPEAFTPEELARARGMNGGLEVFVPMVGSPTAQGEMVVEAAAKVKTYHEFEDLKDNYGKYLVDDDQRDRFQAVLSTKKFPLVGNMAIDFTCEDIDGNKVSLSDFRGKSAVYIDVWATWCGPCIAQVPYLKELEKEYHGNPDIVFMSVSTDAGKDRGKWEKMVREKELGGLQLFAGDRATQDILGPYKIPGIPRFILVDKSGRIVSDNAPRPSTPDIRPLLDKTIGR